MTINKCFFSGNLTRDAELRETGRQPSLFFTVAVNERRRDRETGQWVDGVVYVNFALFGNLAPAIAPQMLKGSRVTVESRYTTRQYEAKDGTAKTAHTFIVAEIEVSGARHKAEQPKQDAYAQDDIPF